MADVSLKIHPEAVGGRYSSGETVRGRIQVEVSRAFPDATLVVVIYCEANVKNAKFSYDAEKEKASEKVYIGPWTSGNYDYPFEINIPQGAHTYDGHIISAVWRLGARVERGAGEILSETTDDPELLIDTAPVSPKETEGLTRKEVLYTETGDKLRCCFVVSTALVLGGMAIPFTIGKDDADSIIFGGVIALLGILMFIPITYSALVKKRFREIKVRIAARRVLRGEKVPCSVTFTSKLSFDVERVYVKMTGEEFVDARSSEEGSDGELLRHVLHENIFELSMPSKHVQAGTPFHAEGELMIPKDALCSINVMSGENGIALQWVLWFYIEMKKWPDWFHREKIKVV